jgi:class 3 adenylate cyclase
VDRLILYNTTARFLADDDYEIGLPPETVDAVFDQLTTLWGAEGQVAISAPSRAGDARFEAWYAKFLRSIGTPREMAELIRHAMRLDARAALAHVAVPTLVMHRTGYPIVPASHGRYLADHIAGAEYVEVPGVDGPMFWEEPDLLMRLIREFVAEEAPERSAQIATILLTDIVRSTERAEALGDREWSATVAVHLDVIQDAVTAYAGTVVKPTGDGAVATFADPADAVSAATRLRARLDDMGITVRVGLHTGRIEVASDDIHGLAVHIAARVMAAAGDGDIVASRTVRDLLLGSSHRFDDLGRHTLRGVEGEWELYRLDEGAR